jgi:hypothetical protein
MTGTLTTPVAGQPNSTQDPLVATAITTLNGLLTASNLLDGGQLGAGTVASGSLASGVALANLGSASVTDAKIASPNNSVYKSLLVGGVGNPAAATGTYYFLNSGGNTLGATGTATTTTGPLVYEVLAADHSVGSLTSKMRVKLVVSVGAASPSTVTLTAGLYPLTISAGNFTMGTVVTGSTAASSGLATNTISRFNSGDFTIPADGPYVLGVVIGSITVPAGINLTAQLQTRNV